MTEDIIQEVRARYRGFGMVAFSTDTQSVVAVGDSHSKINKQLEDSRYSISDSDVLLLRCDMDDFV